MKAISKSWRLVLVVLVAQFSASAFAVTNIPASAPTVDKSTVETKDKGQGSSVQTKAQAPSAGKGSSSMESLQGIQSKEKKK